jgi:alpha-L-fucosidase 2
LRQQDGLWDGSEQKGLKMQTSVDWASFLARNDPVWERLPAEWTDGAFIGNGRLPERHS